MNTQQSYSEYTKKNIFLTLNTVKIYLDSKDKNTF